MTADPRQIRTSPATGRLRVAVLGLGRYSGGSPIGLHMARALSAHHDVTAFVDSQTRNLPQWQSSAVPVHLVQTYSSWAGAVISLLAGRRIGRLARDIRRVAPDVIVVPFLHLWVLPLMQRLGTPFVVVVHDPEPHPGLIGRLAHLIERRVVRRSRQVIIHSQFFRPHLEERYGVHGSRVTVVPIGPLVDYANDARQVTEANPPTPVVLCFGRMERYKGIDVLLQAVPSIRARVPTARIRCVGHGLGRAALRRARRVQGVEVVHRWVPDDEVPAVFRAATVIALPYTSATQSGVIPIAAAFAKPVVASAVGGLPEQLADGRCGWLVPPGDPEALAHAIVTLLTDAARATALGEALHEEYLRARSWAGVGATLADVCRRASAQ